jgi:hypothetical protein
MGCAAGRAKQTADIVLADDNFATIVAAIEEGRSIRANIRRFASYVFVSNVAELAPFLLFVFLRIPLPLAIMQVLAIDLGTFPPLALGRATGRDDGQPPGRRALLTQTGPADIPLVRRPEAGSRPARFSYYLAAGWQPSRRSNPSMRSPKHARRRSFGIVGGGCLVAGELV